MLLLRNNTNESHELILMLTRNKTAFSYLKACYLSTVFKIDLYYVFVTPCISLALKLVEMWLGSLKVPPAG